MNLEATLAPASAPPKAAEARVVLTDISWADYDAIGNILSDRPGLRLTYDRGRLEIMTTSSEHERMKKWLGRIVETVAEDLGLEIAPGGNTTFRREDLDRGLEPDECFWIANEKRMRTCEEWDPNTDPPPDLVIEIEVSGSAVNRMALYAALGVPEVWRCDGSILRAHLLQSDGTYLASETSPTFPGLPIAELVVYLQPLETMSYLGMVRVVREWVRQHRQTT